MATVTKCECGKRMSKYANHCTACSKAKQARIHAEAAIHVDRGTCPRCCTKLRRNLSLTGWWQCGAYGVESFRAAEDRGKPACGFQCFTE